MPENKIEIKFFDQSVENFMAQLDRPTLAKTLRTIDLLEKFASHLGMPHSKKIDDNLFELRVRGKKEIRIIYTFYKKAIVLLCAFIKKDQKIPRKFILLAKNRLRSLES